MIKVEQDATEMIEAITKDAFGSATMLFQLQGIELMQPLSD
ncbi:hypothetical protein LBWT_X2420 (plasmid) [Leptolyngbya boryana IAM M-101]|nr:hypothetical protein LBWT_X2420 [Leptolyngbya boryana IAM M-101]BAS66518.1 hypothetical protein LBDG_X2420 [Leptolyngbya boryana dg5]